MHVRRDDVRLWIAVVIHVDHAVLFVKIDQRVAVLARVVALDADLAPQAAGNALLRFMRIQVQHMRVARRALQRDGPVIDDEVRRRDHVAAIRRADRVVIRLAEHAADDWQHEQQPIGVLLPARHAVEQLPCHVLPDAVGAGALHAFRIWPQHAALDEV